MALTDITERIIKAAEKDAEKLMQVAGVRLKDAVALQQKVLQQKEKDYKAELAADRDKKLQQYKELLSLETRQKILAAKRQSLDKVFAELKTEVLADKKKLTAIFVQMLKKDFKPVQGVFYAGKHTLPALAAALQELDIELPVNPAPLADGAARLDTNNSQIDLSLDLYFQELQAIYELSVLNDLLKGA